MSVEFDLDLQNDFVQGHGESILWSRANLCPCSVEHDANRPNPNCRACLGKGFVYDDPVSIIGIVTALSFEKQIQAVGEAVAGTLMLGLGPFETHRLGDNDVVTVTWDEGQPYEGELVVRGQSDTDQLKFPAGTVHEAFTVDVSTGTRTFFFLGADFTVSGNIVTWTGNKPLTGQTWSIRYDVKSYEYVAWVSPMQRLDHGIPLGRRAMLRRRLIAPATA
jgi:hypothetical protein